MKHCTKSATFLGITGTLQARQGVIRLVAKRLWKPQLGLVPAANLIRKFCQPMIYS